MFDAAVIDGVFAIVILSFMFFVKMELCFLFFVTEGVLTFFNNTIFSLVWLFGLVFSSIGFEVWGSS